MFKHFPDIDEKCFNLIQNATIDIGNSTEFVLSSVQSANSIIVDEASKQEKVEKSIVYFTCRSLEQIYSLNSAWQRCAVQHSFWLSSDKKYVTEFLNVPFNSHQSSVKCTPSFLAAFHQNIQRKTMARQHLSSVWSMYCVVKALRFVHACIHVQNKKCECVWIVNSQTHSNNSNKRKKKK